MFDKIFNLYLIILDSFLFPLLTLPPVLAIFIISTIFSLISIGVSISTVNKEELKKIKERILSLQEEIKLAQKRMDSEFLSKLTQEIIKMNFQMLKLKGKSMIIISLLIFPFFPWLNHYFSGVIVAKLPIVNVSMGWILWYIFVSLTISYVVQRIVGREYV